MADQAVLEVQNWLNATYGNVSGFEKVNPDGHTGWPTIYALREALQHELGITDIGEGFGPATRSALASVVGNLKPGYTGNIAQLIQGAFWCKGIDPGSNLNQEFSTATQQAFKTLQTDAGLNADGIVTVNLMAALFDMSAFVLVAGGDKNVRQLQQWLNADYSQYIGIMPCDGIYQRDTNVGLIYALQRALGISADVANGNFGDATNAALKAVSLSVGATGLLVKIVKYGLYLNSMYDGDFGENFGSDVATSIIKFRKFMKYPNEDSGVADYTVIKGLVTSNGDTGRDSIALDTATQLTASDVQHFRDYGFSIVGRYLTGTVGADFKPKNLTSTEVKTILDGGLKFFPIYEDGGYVESYFTAAQGQKDGQTAISAALSLGLPADTVIYFAVDVDFQEGDIDGTVIPYINAVQNVLNRSIYKAGIYGTRNVCLHAEKTGIDYSFVANMSYGWSGNLGFKMPDNWAFDQFVEYPIYGIDIDQDASSGRDQGVSAVTEATPATQKAYVANRLLSIFPDYHNLFGTINWTVSSPTQHITTPLADYYVTLEDKWSATVVDNKTGVLTIQDAKIINESTDILEQFESAMSSYNVGDLAGTFNKLAPMIGNGAIKAGLAIRDGMVGFKVAIESSVENTSTSSSVENQFTLTLETYIHKDQVPQNDYDPVYQPVTEPNPTFAVDLEKVATIVVVGLIVTSTLPESGAVTALGGLFNAVRVLLFT
ncbi:MULTISPECIES: glycoside hydrolase domain-containing protein [Lacticaseibacillus]|uniref:glycoside hydrolase domain-containing protein n=1 Tax=Lacticaseibacillus TaxID=2759736 RepID=UPI00063DAB01|nr:MULTISPECIES: glycoside hydrolase domain-containing protein [Lacticaseibacillus]KLI75362.1 peptidoglycan-binding protein [Lacticaseibacillus casei]